MKGSAIAEIYQAEIRKRFPHVIVRSGIGEKNICDCEYEPGLTAYMIPDNDGGEFIKFLIKELWQILERDHKLPFWGVITVHESDTKEYYPEHFYGGHGHA